MLYLCGRKEEGFIGCAEGGVSPSSVPLQVKPGAAVHSVLVGSGQGGPAVSAGPAQRLLLQHNWCGVP